MLAEVRRAPIRAGVRQAGWKVWVGKIFLCQPMFCGGVACGGGWSSKSSRRFFLPHPTPPGVERPDCIHGIALVSRRPGPDCSSGICRLAP